jgi:hypothetical protein
MGGLKSMHADPVLVLIRHGNEAKRARSAMPYDDCLPTLARWPREHVK